MSLVARAGRFFDILRTRGAPLWPLAAVLAAALLARLLLLAELSGDVLFESPMLDENGYVEDAVTLASGGSIEVPFWQPPGLAFLLAGLFRTLGAGLMGPRIAAVLASVAGIAATWCLARRIGSPRMSLLAATLAAGHGALVFATSEILPAVWSCSLEAIALVLVTEAGLRGSRRLAIGGGLGFGLAALFQPTVLVFLPVAAGWLVVGAARRRVVCAALLLSAAALPVLPATLANHRANGEWVFISTNGGINLYLGNNPSYPESLLVRPGHGWEALLAEPENAGFSGAKASGYFTRKTIAYIREKPLSAALLYLRKLHLFFHSAEIPRDSDLYEARERSRVVAALVWPAPWRLPGAILYPLALWGLALAWRSSRAGSLVTLFVVVQALSTSAFFVSARHRVPTLPALCVLAAFGAAHLCHLARERKRRRTTAALAGGVALAAVCNAPVPEASLSLRGELEFYRGVAHVDRGDQERALGEFRLAAEKRPLDPRPWFEMGNLLAERGRVVEAVESWRRAAAVDPHDERPLRNVARAFFVQGDLDHAAQALQTQIDARRHPDRVYSFERYQLARIALKRADLPGALALLQRAAADDPASMRTWMQPLAEDELRRTEAPDSYWHSLSALLEQLGDFERAERARNRARQAGDAAATLLVPPENGEGR